MELLLSGEGPLHICEVGVTLDLFNALSRAETAGRGSAEEASDQIFCLFGDGFY